MSLRRALAGAALLFVLWAFTPPAGLDLCGFHRLTHLPCPLCGLTRALFALGKGNWREAMRLNALSPLGLAMLLASFWDSSLRNRLWGAGVGAFAVYGTLRLLS